MVFSVLPTGGKLLLWVTWVFSFAVWVCLRVLFEFVGSPFQFVQNLFVFASWVCLRRETEDASWAYGWKAPSLKGDSGMVLPTGWKAPHEG